jgi:hypothetical protein
MTVHHPGVGGDHLQLVSGHDSSVPRRRRESEAIAWTVELQATPGVLAAADWRQHLWPAAMTHPQASHTSARLAGSGEKELRERYFGEGFRTGTRE